MQPSKIIRDLLANPYPHDLMEIRRKVEHDYWGDELLAKEEMDAYCTNEFMLEARQKWRSAQDVAREWLDNNKES